MRMMITDSLQSYGKLIRREGNEILKVPYLHLVTDEEFDMEEYEEAPSPSREVLALMMQDMMNKEQGKVAPDTTGADFFFLEEFITDAMESDFSAIEQDFLSHCSDKLHEFNKAGWYGEDERWNHAPDFAIKKKMVRLMYNGAKLSDSYCTELIKYLYKLYHKREYNQLKRFHKISPGEIFSLAENEQGDVSYGITGRILSMCRFLNIELDDKCSILYLLLDKERKEWIQVDADNREYIGVEDDVYEKCARQVDTWMEAGKNKDLYDLRKIYPVYFDEEDFVEVSLRHLEYPDDYMQMCMMDNSDLRTQMTRALTILKIMNPEREYSCEEIQRYAVLHNMVSTIEIENCAMKHLVCKRIMDFGRGYVWQIQYR